MCTGRLYRLHVLWRTYDTLFGSQSARAILSRQDWRVTFALYQRVLFKAIIMTLHQLLEQPTMKKREQSCLEQLVSRTCLNQEPAIDRATITGHVLPRLKQLRATCNNVEQTRHTSVGHRKLIDAVDERVYYPVDAAVITTALVELSAMLQDIANVYYPFHRDCTFHPNADATLFDADRLLVLLADLPAT